MRFGWTKRIPRRIAASSPWPWPPTNPPRSARDDPHAHAALHQFVRRLNPGASEIQPSPPPAGQCLRPFPRPAAGPARAVDDQIEESAELAAEVAAGRLGFETLVLVRRRELNPSHVYTYTSRDLAPAGGWACTSSRLRSPRIRSSPDAQAGQRRVDRTRRLARWSDPRLRSGLRRWRDPVQLATHSTRGLPGLRDPSDGTGLRQLTDGPHHNYNACWLPDGGVAFLSTRTSRLRTAGSRRGGFAPYGAGWVAVTPLSANIVNDFTPSAMDDGRILYSRWNTWTSRRSHPELVDHKARWHRPGRVLRQPRAQPRHLHGSS